MEVLPEGKNFRLVHEEELPEILELLGKYLPDSLKVSGLIFCLINGSFFCFYKLVYLTKETGRDFKIL